MPEGNAHLGAIPVAKWHQCFQEGLAMQPYTPLGSPQEPFLRGRLGFCHTYFKDSHILRYIYFTLQKNKQASSKLSAMAWG